MLIGAQAFQESPAKHAPAVVVALVPQIAAWGKGQIDNALAAANLTADSVGMDKLDQNGALYHGLTVLGSGATLAGIILGAITVMIIDRKLEKAAAFALAGAVLTFFGLIHSQAVGIGRTPEVALGYVIIAGVLFACAKRGAFALETAPHAPPIEHGVGETA
jgi:AGZA family xanthine/uracil permease-like MFS transporter